MIRNWLRSWLGIPAIAIDWRFSLGEEHKLVMLARERADMALARIGELEKEISRIEAANGAEIQELRDRLEMPAKRKPSGRPFSVLQKIAAMGAEVQRMKDAG